MGHFYVDVQYVICKSSMRISQFYLLHLMIVYQFYFFYFVRILLLVLNLTKLLICNSHISMFIVYEFITYVTC